MQCYNIAGWKLDVVQAKDLRVLQSISNHPNPCSVSGNGRDPIRAPKNEAGVILCPYTFGHRLSVTPGQTTTGGGVGKRTRGQERG